jgi:hypothetical protein
MVELKTHKLYKYFSHQQQPASSGRDNYYSHQTLYVLTLIGKQNYIYLLTLNKKRAIRVRRQTPTIPGKNYYLKKKIQSSGRLRCRKYFCQYLRHQITICRVKIQTPTITGKNYYQKKRYSHLAISDNRLSCQKTNTNYHWKKLLPEKTVTVVWLSQIIICRVKIQAPTITGKNYYRKKGTVVWPSQITVCRVKIQTPTITGKNYYRKEKIQLSGYLR